MIFPKKKKKKKGDVPNKGHIALMQEIKESRIGPDSLKKAEKVKDKHFDVNLGSVPRPSPARSSQRQELQRNFEF